MRITKTPLAMRPRSQVLPLTVKFNLDDYERVRASASSSGLPVSAYLRQKALTGTVKPPTVINPICQDQWRELSRIGSNLNRLLFLLNSGSLSPELAALQPTIEAAKTELKIVRDYLVGSSAA
jgi:hypothetical protein